MYFEEKLYNVLNEADDDKYVSIGYGRYKKKGEEDKEGAEVFQKDDAGNYVPASSDSDQPEDKPKKVTKIDTNPYDNDPGTDDYEDWADATADSDDSELSDAMDGAEEGILDAVSRGMDYGDPDVQDMVRDDIEAAKEAGATVKDFEELANKLQDPEASEIIKDALEDVYGDAGNLADPDMDNPGYEDDEELEAKAEESDEAISDAIKNAIPQSMEMFDQTRDEIFDEIINLIADEDEYADIVDNIDSKDPDDYPSSATFNIAHHLIRAGIARGELDRDYDEMQVANYLENMEADLHDQIMNPDQYDEIKQVKEVFQKRAGILRG